MFNITVLKDILNDRKFISLMLAVAMPIALQNLISSSLNMVDTVMIGALGEVSISAVGLANQVYFLLMLFLFGINSGISIYIAQFWGKQDLKSIHKTLGFSILGGFILSLPFFIGAVFFPSVIMGIFTTDSEVIGIGVEYLRITGWSYLLMAFSFSYSIACRSVGDARLPMIAGSISLVANTGLNYVLIFGVLGFPALGVAGAAIATVIARAIELMAVVGVVYARAHPLQSPVRELVQIRMSFIRPILKTALPVVLNEGFWAIGMTLYAIAYARSGTEAYAAVQIAGTVERLFFIFSFGLGSACSVMIGNELGADHIETAKVYAGRFIRLGILISLAVGLLMALIAVPSTYLFNVSPGIRWAATCILFVNAGTMVLKMISTILIIGIFRGGGDTTFSFVLEICCVYLIGVPMAFIGALVLKLPIFLVVLMVSLEELVKNVVGLYRVKSGVWAKNLVAHME